MADGRIIIDTQIDSSGAEKGVGKLGSTLSGVAKTGLKVFTGAVATASVAVGALAKLSIDQYANYEQLVGGVETLFKDSSKQIIQYADSAYVTAGLSANEYMETITGFSASLIQSLGGDTKKASVIGNKAIIDMSDNANKMGSSMESIQNAYQGFAKQNYTMLDNLKLGYGGTKEEMARLLKDAEKLTGKKFNLNNFADIVEAIHAVQTELGITGTTAKEASETISGSLNMVKGAWKNTLTAMSDDGADLGVAIENLVDSAKTFGKNILPRIKIALEGIGTLFSELAESLPTIIMEIVPSIVEAGINVIGSLAKSIMDSLPKMLEMGMNLNMMLIKGIKDSLPQIVRGGLQIVNELIKSLMVMLPQILELGMEFIIQLALGIAQMLPSLIPQAIHTLLTLIDTLLNNIDLIIDAGIQLIIGLADGLIKAIPMLIDKIPIIIDKLLIAFSKNMPKLIKAGLDINMALAKGIIQAIPNLIKAVPQIITSLVDGFRSYYSNLFILGEEIIGNIWGKINEKKEWLKTKVGEFFGEIVNNIRNFFNTTIPQIIDEIANFFSNLPYKVGYFMGETLGKIVQWGIDTKNSIIETCTNVYNSIIEWFSMIPGRVSEFMSTAYNSVVQWFSQLPGRVSEWLRNTINKLIDFKNDMGKKASEAGSNFANTLINKVREIPSQMVECGKNIVRGLWDGIIGMGSWIKNKVSSFFKGIVDGAKNALGIHSPSRVFRDQVGKYMAQGVGVGFEDETDSIRKSMENDLSGLVAKMSATVDYETAITTARVVSYNNRKQDVNYNDSKASSTNKILEIPVIIDGREVVRAIAPYQDELEAYTDRRMV